MYGSSWIEEAELREGLIPQGPIPKGGLEIILRVTFTIEEDKKRYVDRLKELISNNYETPQENEEVDAGAGNSEMVEIDDDSGGDDNDLDIMFMSDGENADEDDAEQDNVTLVVMFEYI